MPGRGGAVLGRHGLWLRVSAVPGVVPAGVAQVDAAQVGDVAGGIVVVPDHQQLLMMRAAGAHPHVQQHLGPVILQRFSQVPVLRGREVQQIPVGAPHQATEVHAALIGGAQHRGNVRSRLVRELLVRIPAPIREENEVPPARGLMRSSSSAK